MRYVFHVLAVLAGFIQVQATAQTCGEAEQACVITSGTYHILLPREKPVAGTIIHLHGGGGTGKGLLKSGIARLAVERGYVFIAPNGEHPGARFRHNWAVRARNSHFDRDDIDFLRDILADASERHGADADKVLLSGFSRGGSMVWDIACHAPDLAFAYAPIAGAFWDDLPETCTAPVNLFHTHGWDDRTVPLEGRSLRNGTIVQGDVWASLFILRDVNGCVNRQPASSEIKGDQWFRHWSDCKEGRIDLLLHPGGHGAPAGWAATAVDWFEERLAERDLRTAD